MKRTKLKDITIPLYSNGEEIFNVISHIIGVGLSLITIVFCIIASVKDGNTLSLVSGIIFGGSMLLLYLMSSIYHGLNPEKAARRVFRIIDHCSIFILIAGTYTPISLCVLTRHSFTEGIIYFVLIWAMAIIGIVLNSIDLKKFRIISLICYLVMGWCIIVRANVVIDILGIKPFLLLLSGGIAYSIGALFYVLGKKHKWMHSIFHVLCVIGSLLHFLFVFLYVV